MVATAKEDFADSESSQSRLISAEAKDAETLYSMILDYEAAQQFLFGEYFDSAADSVGHTESESNKNSKCTSNTMQSGIGVACDTNILSSAPQDSSSPIKSVPLFRSERPTNVNIHKNVLLIISTELLKSEESDEKPECAKANNPPDENYAVYNQSGVKVSTATPAEPQFSPPSSQEGLISNTLANSRATNSHYPDGMGPQPPLDSPPSSNIYNRPYNPEKLESVFSGVFNTLSNDSSGANFSSNTKTYQAEPLMSLGQQNEEKPIIESASACYRNPILETCDFPYTPIAPITFPTRDSSLRLILHEDMLTPRSEASLERQITPVLTYSWTKWICLMISGLVVVPVYFFLAFGMLDKKGFYFHNFCSDNKKLIANFKYHQRYSVKQKLLSFIVGVFWLAVILAMIGVGFGLGLT